MVLALFPTPTKIMNGSFIKALLENVHKKTSIEMQRFDTNTFFYYVVASFHVMFLYLTLTRVILLFKRIFVILTHYF